MNNENDLKDWMVTYLSNKLEVDAGLIDTSLMFDRFGLDSIAAVCMVSDLSDRVGATLDPGLLYDHPSIDALATHLCTSLEGNLATPS